MYGCLQRTPLASHLIIMAKCLFSTCSFNVMNFSVQTWSRFKAKLKLKLKQSKGYTKHSPSKQDVYCRVLAHKIWASSIITPAASKLAVYIEDRHLSALLIGVSDASRGWDQRTPYLKCQRHLTKQQYLTSWKEGMNNWKNKIFKKRK